MALGNLYSRRMVLLLFVGGCLFSFGTGRVWTNYVAAAKTAPIATPAVRVSSKRPPAYVPHVRLVTTDNAPVASSDLLNDLPIVLSFGSLTCSVFLNELEGFEALAEQYKHDFRFYVVYTREAHPFHEWPQTTRIEERQHRATVLTEVHDVGLPVLIDPVGSHSFSEMLPIADKTLLVVDPNGRILVHVDTPSSDNLKQLAESLDTVLDDRASVDEMEASLSAATR